jgi:hypothetical protein
MSKLRWSQVQILSARQAQSFPDIVRTFLGFGPKRLTQTGFGLLPQIVRRGAVYARWHDWLGALLIAADVIEEARS